MASEPKPKEAPAAPARYKVLRPIELSGTLYLPEGAIAPKKPRSAGNGAQIKVDTTGIIELTEAQAAEMTAGQIAEIKSTVKSQESKVKNKSS